MLPALELDRRLEACGDPFLTTCRNISTGGMYIDTNNLVPVGSRIRLEVGSDANTFMTEAVVARVELRLAYTEEAQAIGKPSPDAARMTVARALVRLVEEMAVAG